MVTIIVSALTMLFFAVVLGYLLGWADVFFHVPVHPKISACLAILPNANCGACGFVGCADYAAALVKGAAPPTLCNLGGTSVAKDLADILGVGMVPRFPYRPVVHCAATYEHRLQRHAYRGEPTCVAANLIAGVQGCTYGCLGFGDCQRACKYDAIHVRDGLSVVDYDKCVGCKACARVCPRNIITMVPFKSDRMMVIACSNMDQGKAVTEVCDVGCIGCKMCAKTGPELVEFKNNLPIFNYEKYDPVASRTILDAIRSKCKRAGLVYIGKPSAADLDAVKDEPLPATLKSDFKTTVDDTEWRG